MANGVIKCKVPDEAKILKNCMDRTHVTGQKHIYNHTFKKYNLFSFKCSSMFMRKSGKYRHKKYQNV